MKMGCMAGEVPMTTSFIYRTSKRKPKSSRNWAGTYPSRSMPLTSPTRSMKCNASLPASLAPRCCLASLSAYEDWDSSPWCPPRWTPTFLVALGDVELISTHHFTCLGCITSSDAKVDSEIDSRTSKADSSFGGLRFYVKHLTVSQWTHQQSNNVNYI